MGKQVSVTNRAQRETAWRQRLARYATSKQTVEAFCHREAVPVGTFYGWRARLRARDVEPAQMPRHPPTAPSPFIDLGSVNSAAASTAAPGRDPAPHQASHHARSAIDLRLDLGGGVVLHIVRH